MGRRVFQTLYSKDHNLSGFFIYDKICTFLRLSMDEYIAARNELIRKDLVDFDGRLYQVLSLPEIRCEPSPNLFGQRSKWKAAIRPLSVALSKRLLENSMTTVENIEITHLNLRNEHTRIRQPSAVRKRMKSIERFGQLMPVLVCNDDKGTPILIDGYLRVKALKCMGTDLVVARMWDQSEPVALV